MEVVLNLKERLLDNSGRVGYFLKELSLAYRWMCGSCILLLIKVAVRDNWAMLDVLKWSILLLKELSLGHCASGLYWVIVDVWTWKWSVTS